MLPIHILIQNLLYDISQTTILFDYMDKEYLTKPQIWDSSDLGRFMLWIGPISSYLISLRIWLCGGSFSVRIPKCNHYSNRAGSRNLRAILCVWKFDRPDAPTLVLLSMADWYTDILLHTDAMGKDSVYPCIQEMAVGIEPRIILKKNKPYTYLEQNRYERPAIWIKKHTFAAD